MGSKLALSGVLLASALIAAPAALASGENQGDLGKVIMVGDASCVDPVPATKVEGDLGATIEVTAHDAIDFVTVKSGKGAAVASTLFDTYSWTITLSKDVSNYVVWTCPGGGEEVPDEDVLDDAVPPEDVLGGE